MALESDSSAKDPRVYLAAERTLLAWVRTGLAMMGFGFVVARFGLFLSDIAGMHVASPTRRHGFSLWGGTALVILGVVVNLSAAIRHWHSVGQLDRGLPLHFPRLSFAVAVAALLALVGLLMALYLLFGLNS